MLHNLVKETLWVLFLIDHGPGKITSPPLGGGFWTMIFSKLIRSQNHFKWVARGNSELFWPKGRKKYAKTLN